MTQVLNCKRFADLFAATEYAMQHGGRIELSEDFDAWIVTLPDHDDPVHGHNPIVPDPTCRKCRKLGWTDDAPVRADVAEVEGVAR